MKISEAIEVLMAQRYSFPTKEMRVINDALNLGIAALTVIEKQRKYEAGPEVPLLRGETRD